MPDLIPKSVHPTDTSFLAPQPKPLTLCRNSTTPYRCGHRTGPQPLELEHPNPNAWFYLTGVGFDGDCHACSLKTLEGKLKITHWRYEVSTSDLKQDSMDVGRDTWEYRIEGIGKRLSSRPSKKTKVVNFELEEEIDEMRARYWDEVQGHLVQWRRVWGLEDFGVLQEFLDKAEKLGEHFVDKRVRILKRTGTLRDLKGARGVSWIS